MKQNVPRNKDSNHNKSEEPQSSKDKVWFDYVEKLPFQSDNYIATFADKMLSLNSAVLAVYIGALKLFEFGEFAWYFIFPVLVFLIAITCALWIILPKKVNSNYSEVDKLEQDFIEALNKRTNFAIASLILFFIGILSAVFVILVVFFDP